MVFQVKELLEETEKGAKVKIDIPRVSVLYGSYEVRIQEIITWVPKSKVDDKGYLDPEWMGWKMKPVIIQKGQRTQEDAPESNQENAA
jgi:hypothetical protein